jgi:hypothetical protein
LNNKKAILLILLCLALTLVGAGTTYSYFTYNEKVENSVNISMGNINADFIKLDGTGKFEGPIVNINELRPGTTASNKLKIKNTGSLTEKIAVSLDDFKKSEKDDFLPYLNIKVESGSIVLFEGKLADYLLSKNEKTVLLKDKDNKFILLKADESVEVNLSFSLTNNVPYNIEGKNLKFSINIYATQPNDPKLSNEDGGVK